MSIAGRRTLEELRRGDWDRFAKRCGLGPRFVRQRVEELCDLAFQRTNVVAEELAIPGMGDAAPMTHAGLVRRRAARLARTVR